MSRILKCAFALLAVFASLSCSLWAQTGSVTGRVTDASGAVVPGTQIRIIQEATGVERTVTANDVGYYTVPLLLPGEYRMEVEQPGFRGVT